MLSIDHLSSEATAQQPTASLIVDQEELSRKARFTSLHKATPYGNYKNYYSFRAETIPDERLTCRSDSVDATDVLSRCRDRVVLDLGCNAGKISREIVQFGFAKKVIGIDIDEELIEQASSLVGADDEGDKIEFILGDFMQLNYFNALTFAPEVILLFSITKWLHLNHGDAGMLRLFDALFSVLPSGGILVVEPQEWANYQQARKKNKELRAMFRTLELRPNFDRELRNAGFTFIEKTERKEGGTLTFMFFSVFLLQAFAGMDADDHDFFQASRDRFVYGRKSDAVVCRILSLLDGFHETAQHFENAFLQSLTTFDSTSVKSLNNTHDMYVDYVLPGSIVIEY